MKSMVPKYPLEFSILQFVSGCMFLTCIHILTSFPSQLQLKLLFPFSVLVETCLHDLTPQ